jgi:hypothetical protein
LPTILSHLEGAGRQAGPFHLLRSDQSIPVCYGDLPMPLGGSTPIFGTLLVLSAAGRRFREECRAKNAAHWRTLGGFDNMAFDNIRHLK